MKKILLTATAASILLLSGCTKGSDAKPMEASAKSEVSAAEAQKAITVADGKYKEIKGMHSIVWQSTKPEIDKAHEAAKTGDYAKALKHANEAIYQIDEAIAEYNEGLKIWHSAMPQALMK